MQKYVKVKCTFFIISICTISNEDLFNFSMWSNHQWFYSQIDIMMVGINGAGINICPILYQSWNNFNVSILNCKTMSEKTPILDKEYLSNLYLKIAQLGNSPANIRGVPNQNSFNSSGRLYMFSLGSTYVSCKSCFTKLLFKIPASTPYYKYIVAFNTNIDTKYRESKD